ncbi:histone H1.01-like [Hemiscyllium ocellatum]|uniref:histone H1.01-like n=1 Tax=Hemiscyllium ocellatum TaxID=170820 RepID=UPI0029673350|nr:histone H1.01-like [Hemiscyllium ocellatum]
MSDSAAAETAPPASAPIKAKAPKKKAAAPRKKPPGPGLGELILNVVGDIKDRKGASLSAVKKALERSGIDVGKRKTQIKMSIRRCLANGSLVLVKGQGVSGSFKLPKNPVKAKAGKKAGTSAAAKKPAVKKSPAKKPTVKKLPAKKATAKKSQAKKATVKKSPAKKAVAKKSPAKKASGKKTAPPKKAVSKAAPKKRTLVKKVKKAKGPKAPKPLSKPAKGKAKPKAKVTKTAAKK